MTTELRGPLRRPDARARLAAVLFLLTGCGGAGRPDPLEPSASEPIAPRAGLSTRVVAVGADAFVRSDVPNQATGAHDSLRVRRVGTSGADRALLAVPPADLSSAVGADSVVAATLELPIRRTGSDWGATGRPVAIHRMTSAWTESAVTWNCPVDLLPGNGSLDCPGAGWAMSGTPSPFLGVPTAQATIRNGQTGTLRFDVTADVRAFVGGLVPNHGWLVKRVTEGTSGTIVLRARESAAPPRLVLELVSTGVPADAPDFTPAWMYADTNVSQGSAAIGAPFVKRIIVVRFVAGTPVAVRDSIIRSVAGSVVGGSRLGAGVEGHYFVRIEDVVGDTLLARVARLRNMPAVAGAFVNVGGTVDWRLPNDSAGWTPTARWNWGPHVVDPNPQTWALSMIRAPWAWGCSSGDSLLPVAVIDWGFRWDAIPDLRTLGRATAAGSVVSSHGAAVAGLLAAQANNSSGMAGVLWRADVRLHDFSVHQPGQGSTAWLEPIVREVTRAADSGARVINLSVGLLVAGPVIGPDGSVQQINARTEWQMGFLRSLTELATRGKRPLLVVSAGNDGVDARWNGTPMVRDSFPGQVLTVGAMTSQLTLWSGSNVGPYVDLVAPGADVHVFNELGGVRIATGTSFAAPLVTGIAGLVLSLDPRLAASDVRDIILAGASADSRRVTAAGRSYPVADAYGALRQLSRRPGGPLCGNRVWSGNGFWVERGGGAIEQVLDTPDASPSFYVLHDGHHVQDGNNVLWQWSNGSWSVRPGAFWDYDLEQNGSSRSRWGYSHGGDTVAAAVQVSGSPSPVTAVVLRRTIDDAVLDTVARFPGHFAESVAYSPEGTFVVAHMTRRDTEGLPLGGTIYRIPLPTGAPVALAETPAAGGALRQIAISEDGRDLMVAWAAFPYACRLEFRDAVTFGEVRPPILGEGAPDRGECRLYGRSASTRLRTP